MFIIYLFAFFIVVYLFLMATIRIKMHFWHTQPVFHLYNLWYWLNPPGIINKEPPPVNKFVNLSNNTLLQAPAEADPSNNQLTKQICQFICDYYITHESAAYKPTEQDILAYLQCSNQPAFFNLYYETPLPFSTAAPTLAGIVSARLLNVTLHSKTFGVYYIDNLCVQPGYRKKGIAPEMIQTMYYRISRVNPNVNAYLFKREGEINAIVPLVYYDTHVFDMTDFRPQYVLNIAMKLIDIGLQQLNVFVTFIQDQLQNFDCIVLPDISNIMNLIKLGKIKIYGILLQGELIAVYVFRLLELSYAGKKATECITIVSACKTPDVLMAGFTMSWSKISALTHCQIVFIEGTAHSHPVIKALMKTPSAVFSFKSPTAFFLYNYATYSIKNTKTLLLY